MIKARASGSKVYLYFMKKSRQARHRILRNSCVHKLIPIQKANAWKRVITQPKIYKICSNINQFIYILVLNYMPNIGILQIFCSQDYSYIKCVSPKKGNKSIKYKIFIKAYQFIYILVQSCKQNISIVALGVLQIFYSQGYSYMKFLYSKKRNNSLKNLRNMLKS